MNDDLDAAVDAGIAAGVLPRGSRAPQVEQRPWPVVLLTALGAWLSALPLLGVVGLLLGDNLQRGIGPYAVGVLLLAGALIVLRHTTVPAFVEQLALPALLVGGGSLGMGLARDLGWRTALGLLTVIALALAFAIGRPWLRALLGAAAAALLLTLLGTLPWWPGAIGTALFGTLAQLLLMLWWAGLALPRLAGPAAARLAVALEPIAAGWLLVVLAGLALSAGMAFLVAGPLGASADLARGLAGGATLSTLPTRALSVGLALLGAGLVLRRWPSLRRADALVFASVLAVLAAWMPTLGAALLACAVSATTRRLRLAAVALLAAIWIVGAFYYALQWPLANKAALLVGAAAVLAVPAWLGLRRAAVPAQTQRRGDSVARPAALALGAVATLLVANLSIAQKEALIARGRPLFIELVPVDPCSLMQGDYMRLAFRVPPDIDARLGTLLTLERPLLVARADARGVATPLRLDAGHALAADELRIELTPKAGRWIIVSDAWFFREGDGARWQAARYGEFRVAADGRALLVGMADAQLRPIGR